MEWMEQAISKIYLIYYPWIKDVSDIKLVRIDAILKKSKTKN